MDDKDINNVHAWRMLQKGRASPEDQKLAFKIHRFLLSQEKRKTSSITTHRNMLLDLLIIREKIPKTKAYGIVASAERVSVDSIRKPYIEWERQEPELRKIESDSYWRSQSNFIDEEENRLRTARIVEAVDAVDAVDAYTMESKKGDID